jgi:hypothetical protein
MKSIKIISLSITLIFLAGISIAAPDCSDAQIAITNADWFSEDQVIDIEVANAGNAALNGFKFETGDGKLDYEGESSKKIKPGEKESFLLGSVWETPTEDLEVESKECSNVNPVTDIVYLQGSEFEPREIGSYYKMNVNTNKQEVPLDMSIITDTPIESNPVKIRSNKEANLYVNGNLEGEGTNFTIKREAGEYSLKLNKSKKVDGLTEIDYTPANTEIEILNKEEIDLELKLIEKNVQPDENFTLKAGPDGINSVSLYKDGNKIGEGTEFKLTEDKTKEFTYSIKKSNTTENGTLYTYKTDSLKIDVQNASIMSKISAFLGNLF